MAQLAFYTFALLHEPIGSEITRPFLEEMPEVFAAAEASPGFVARAVRPVLDKPPFGQDYGAWGLYAMPRFYDGGTHAHSITGATTLSLWTGIDAVRSFSYSGRHKAALGRRAEWFRRGEWPTYVMWWAGNDETPTWEQAATSLEMLHDKGPTVAAFNFRMPFEAGGQVRSTLRA